MTDDTGVSGALIDVVNWRDPWHPQAGGAERYAWEMARALRDRGARVRYLTARAAGQPRRGSHDGIDVVRLGGRFTVYPLMLGWLLGTRLRRGGVPDLVLDCQNGIPFFTPLVLPRRVPVLCVMHHVHTAQFGVHFPGWMARIGRLLEGPAARWVYRRHACVAVSPSTVDAMRDRLRWTGAIYLIPNGSPEPDALGQSPGSVRQPGEGQPSRQGQPSDEGQRSDEGQPPGGDQPPGGGRAHLVWVGRLVAHKRAELVIPLAERGFIVDVIGRGPAEPALVAAIRRAGPAGDRIRLHGFLSEDDKTAVVAAATLHLSTSQGEGWGLSVLEAASLGVPTVAFDVEGLRDAIRDGVTGWLVRCGDDFADVAERAAKELADPERREQVAGACRDWAARLNWPRSTARMVTLAAACLRAGRSTGTQYGPWIVRLGTGTMVAEGPVLDELIANGAIAVRAATPAEQLLGEPAG